MSSHILTIGNYRLLEELASGAFGRVHRAEHIHLSNRIVAVKLLHAHLSSEKERKSFLHEASILEMLKHTHILPILDVGIHEGRIPYMITEFASQGSLRQRLRRQLPQLLPFEETLRILTQIAQALQIAHQQQIVHRDLKPENILFHTNGNALLADFGISTVLGSMSVQQATITGTPPYMAPEQFKGNVSKGSDQYALGCIAYELVTGHRPFTAPDFFSMAIKHMTEQPLPPKHYDRDLPEHVSQAILKALAKERDQRHVDVMSFIQALTTDMTSPAVYMKRGTALYEIKQYEKAVAAYDQVLRFNPQHAEAHYHKGNALSGLKRYEEAVTAYDLALRFNPQHANAHYHKGLALSDLKRYDEAIVAYDLALRFNPQYANAHYHKGLALSDLKRYDEAIVAYDLAFRFNPQDAEAHYHKGLALSDLKRYDEAIVAYDLALRFNPQHANAHNGKGAALRALKRYEEAIVAYDTPTRKPSWIAPGTSLLHTAETVKLPMQGGDIAGLAKIIQDTLRSFRVDAEVRPEDISIGPTIVRFGIRPTGKPAMHKDEKMGKMVPIVDGSGQIVYETRTRVRRIMALQNDLALVLEAKTIRMEAPFLRVLMSESRSRISIAA